MLSWEFPPRIIGGIATHVYNLSRVLTRSGTRVHVVTCDFPDTPAHEVLDGVEVSRVDSRRLSQSDFLLWLYFLNSLMIERGSELLAQERFDLIHAHDWLVGRAALELKNRSGLPLVTTIHATELGRGGAAEERYGEKVHTIELLLIRKSDRVICCSHYMSRHLMNNFAELGQTIDVIPNGVDLSRFQTNSDSIDGVKPVEAAADWPRGKTVLYVGRLVREKGLRTLLEAFEQVCRVVPEAKLVIVGEGPFRERLVDEVYQRGLEQRIRLAGFVDEQTLVGLYRTSQVFVLPSYYEPFGIVVLEAMASRLPVVVSDAGGLAEIVQHEVTGLRVPPHDATSLATAIGRLLEDPALGERLTTNAYALTQDKYKWESVARSTQEVYRRAMTAGQPGSVVVHDANFLTELGLLHLFLTRGATNRTSAKSARELAASIRAPPHFVKVVVGQLAARGYVSTLLETHPQADVRYHLTGQGIIKACADFS